MSSSGDDITQLTQILTLVRTRQVLMVAGLVLFAYDPLLTFEQEHKYIWKSRWTASKAIYLYLRYGALAFQVVICGKFIFGVNVPADYCHKSNMFDILLWIVTQELALLTLALRTSAIYRNKKSINLLIAITYLLNLASNLALSCTMIPHLKWLEFNHGLGLGCMGTCMGPCLTFLRTSMIPPALFEALLCAMTVSKAWQQGDIFSTRLLTMLYRDGFVYFVAIFGLSATQLLLFSSLPFSGSWMAIGGSFSQGIFRALVSIACCRMILNLRGALTEPEDFDTAVQLNSDGGMLTSMHFATVEGTRTSVTEYSTPSDVSSFLVSRHARPTQGGSAESGFEELELIALSPGNSEGAP